MQIFSFEIKRVFFQCLETVKHECSSVKLLDTKVGQGNFITGINCEDGQRYNFINNGYFYLKYSSTVFKYSELIKSFLDKKKNRSKVSHKFIEHFIFMKNLANAKGNYWIGHSISETIEMDLVKNEKAIFHTSLCDDGKVMNPRSSPIVVLRLFIQTFSWKCLYLWADFHCCSYSVKMEKCTRMCTTSKMQNNTSNLSSTNKLFI